MNAEQLKLGQIIQGDQSKDAVHVAVAPVTAAHRLRPGDHVGLLPDGTAGYGVEPIGIVDPFLTVMVAPGQRFWLWLYPGTITSLRHDWEHPAFKAKPPAPVSPPDTSASVAYLTDFAERSGITYARLMDAGRDYLSRYEYLNMGARQDYDDMDDVFWDHFEKVVGFKVEPDRRDTFFSCSC